MLELLSMWLAVSCVCVPVITALIRTERDDDY